MPTYQAPCVCQATFPAISEIDLHRLQDDLDSKLPHDFLNYLRQWNGMLCTNEDYLIPISGLDEDDLPVFCRLYGMDPENGQQPGNRIHDLRYAGEGYHFNSRVPSRFLAIGDGNSWDFLCMSLGNSDFGTIHYWTPGEPWPDDEEIASTDYLRKVANSFSDFWELLTVPVEY